MAMNKLSMWDNSPVRTGESILHPVNRLYTSGGLDKTASSLLPDLVEYLTSLDEPKKEEARAVITALSAYDTFGPNKNGDAFFREDLLRNWKYDNIGEIPMYESFEHYARPYKHHINRPNSKAYGKVLKSFWNPAMDRVELVVSVDREAAPDIVDRIENYGDVSTSMGFRAKYDQCVICGNKARTRREYCGHARRQMLRVLDDGRIVCVRNPEGKFFDISFVVDPADVTSRAVWVNRLEGKKKEKGTEKTASLAESLRGAGEGFDKIARIAELSGDHLDVYLSVDLAMANDYEDQEPQLQKAAADKKAEEDKKADMTKEVGSQSSVILSPDDADFVRRAARKLKRIEPKMSKTVLNKIAEFPLEEALTTMGVLGISLHPEEAQYVAFRRHGMAKTAEKFYDENILVVPITFGADPESGIEIKEESFSAKLASTFVKSDNIMGARSYYPGWLPSRMDKVAFGVNPYVTEARRVSPAMASAIMDDSEVIKGERDRSRGLMSYLFNLMLGSRWALRRHQVSRIEAENPQIMARAYLGANHARRDGLMQDGAYDYERIAAMDRMAMGPGQYESAAYSRRAPLNNIMMTAPMSSYIRGIDGERSVTYPDIGLLETAMSKEASLVAQASSQIESMFKGHINISDLQKTAQSIGLDSDAAEILGIENVGKAVLVWADENLPNV